MQSVGYPRVPVMHLELVCMGMYVASEARAPAAYG